MLQYKIFVKDCLALDDLPIANTICTSFNIERDLLTSTISNFGVIEMPGNIKEGDMLGLVDPYGQIIFNGIITGLEQGNIECAQSVHIFADNWKWHQPNKTTIEGNLAKIITDDFINSSDPLVQKQFPFNLDIRSEEVKGKFKTPDNLPYVVSFEEFINSIYDQYGIIVDVQIPFEKVTPQIVIKKATHVSIKVGNNAMMVRNMTPVSEVFEDNRLFIYNQTGKTLRQAYYTTTSGITTNANSPLRVAATRTAFVFNDDEEVTALRDQYLQEQIYNHKINFDLVLDNQLYDFYDWELGMPMAIWFNGEYYNTLFTGYSMIKQENANLATVQITCGKVRNKLTELINGWK